MPSLNTRICLLGNVATDTRLLLSSSGGQLVIRLIVRKGGVFREHSQTFPYGDNGVEAMVMG